MRSLALWVLVGTMLLGCNRADRELLVVVEGSLVDSVGPRVQQYADDMQLANVKVHVEPFALPANAEDLRDLVFEYIDVFEIEGALLVGFLPSAWYEIHDGFDGYEHFPFDVYLQDRDAVWFDWDDNGQFDDHTELEVDIYTSRLVGMPEQIIAYFDRVDRYRHGETLVDDSAFIFIDDDWARTDTSDVLGLGRVYTRVEVIQKKEESTLQSYLDKLPGNGAEFVYQKIHAAPRLIALDDFGDILLAEEVGEYNLKASFINMTNCSAARFTEENLAEAYTVGTDHGLAIIGSTKDGHLTDPRGFHYSLSLGMTWGEAYVVWYNTEGRYSDKWHLGVVIMGDPLLRVIGDVMSPGANPWQAPELRAVFDDDGPNCQAREEPSTYEDYVRDNPQFF